MARTLAPVWAVCVVTRSRPRNRRLRRHGRRRAACRPRASAPAGSGSTAVPGHGSCHRAALVSRLPHRRQSDDCFPIHYYPIRTPTGGAQRSQESCVESTKSIGSAAAKATARFDLVFAVALRFVAARALPVGARGPALGLAPQDWPSSVLAWPIPNVSKPPLRPATAISRHSTSKVSRSSRSLFTIYFLVGSLTVTGTLQCSINCQRPIGHYQRSFRATSPWPYPVDYFGLDRASTFSTALPSQSALPRRHHLPLCVDQYPIKTAAGAGQVLLSSRRSRLRDVVRGVPRRRAGRRRG
jgi:hypothetical protein